MNKNHFIANEKLCISDVACGACGVFLVLILFLLLCAGLRATYQQNDFLEAYQKAQREGVTFQMGFQKIDSQASTKR